jgi:hypothetical protein
VIYNGCNGGNIQVRAKLTCNNSFSYYKVLPITRSPALTVTPPASYTKANCSVKTPITFSTPGLSCATGYAWNVPSGWTVGGVVSSGSNYFSTGLTTSITVTPNGDNAGTVQVRASLNCSLFVLGSLVIPFDNSAPAPVFAANNPVCLPLGGSATYSASGYPEYDWYVVSGPSTGGLLVNGVANTSAASPVHTTTGSVTITAPSAGFSGSLFVRSRQRFCVSSYIQKDITIGGPGGVQISSGYSCIPQGSTISVSGSAVNATSYNWVVSSPFMLVGSPGSSYIYIQGPSYYANGTVQMSASNACGTNYSNVLNITTCNPGGVAVNASPNPANQVLSVTLEKGDQALTQETDPQALPAYDIKLYDKYNQLRKSGTTKAGKLDLDTSQLPEDTYFLITTKGKEIIKKQIVIKH